jgi:hypothetical protein
LENLGAAKLLPTWSLAAPLPVQIVPHKQKDSGRQSEFRESGAARKIVSGIYRKMFPVILASIGRQPQEISHSTKTLPQTKRAHCASNGETTGAAKFFGRERVYQWLPERTFRVAPWRLDRTGTRQERSCSWRKS